MNPPRRGLRGLALIGLVLVAVPSAGCSSAAKDGATAASEPQPVTTTAAPDPHATVASEQEVDPSFRQGLAKAPSGWVFSTNNVLFTTDDALAITAKHDVAIPPDWAAKGFNHIGDVDVADGVIYAPVEQPDYSQNRQAMLRYDLATLTYIDGVTVTQSHNSWVAVDADAEVAYSMNAFSDQAVVRYDLADGWKPLDSVPLDLALGQVQGGDLRDGFLWLSSDDATDEVYRVDLQTGHVVALGSVGRIDGEAEGIDATALPSGDLHVVTVDAHVVPVRLVNLKVS